MPLPRDLRGVNAAGPWGRAGLGSGSTVNVVGGAATDRGVVCLFGASKCLK